MIDGAKSWARRWGAALFFAAAPAWANPSPTPRLEPAPPTLPSSNIAALAQGAGQVYVGTFDRGVYTVDRHGKVKHLDHPALNPNINTLAVDRERHLLWAGTARGLIRCEIDTDIPLRCRRVGQTDNVHALVRWGAHWVSGGDHSLTGVSDQGQTEWVVDRKHGAPFRAVWSLAVAPDNTLFVGTTSGLYWTRGIAPTGAGIGQNRVSRTAPFPWQRASLVTGELPDDWVTALTVDGNTVHVGTYNAGVVTLRKAGATLTPAARAPSLGYVNPAGIVCLDAGTLAVATMDGLQIGTADRFRTIPTPSPDVTQILRADPELPVASGHYWVATRRGLVLLRLSNESS